MEDIFFELEPQVTQVFDLCTFGIMTDEVAKELVGRNIHFTWRNKKEKSIQTLPGKIISYEAGKVKVFTYNIIFGDSEDEENNKMVLTIPIDEIENYITFDDFTKEFWNLIEVIKCDDDQPLKKIYKVDLGRAKGSTYRIQVGPFKNNTEAQKVVSALKNNGCFAYISK